LNPQQQANFDSFLLEEKPFDLRGFLFKYIIRFWYMYLIFLAIGITSAWVYLRYAIPKYQAKCTLLIKNDEKSSGLSEEKILSELGIMGTEKNLENEIQIIKSRTLMEDVVKNLNLHAVFKVKGRIVDNELYKEGPVLVDSFISYQNASESFDIKLSQDSTLTLSTDSASTICIYGKPCTNKFGTFVFRRNPEAKLLADNTLTLSISDPEIVAGKYATDMSVRIVAPYSSVIQITLADSEKEKAEDILNTLMLLYNDAAIEDINKVNASTLNFIEERLRYLTVELTDVEKGIETFKKANKVPLNVESTAGMLATEISSFEKELAKLEIQLSVLSDVQKYLLSQSESFDYVPANIGISNPAVTDLFKKFNDILIQKERFLRSGTDNNPTVSALDAQLVNLRENILAAIRDEMRNLELTKNQTERKTNQLLGRSGTLPTFEREYREIFRQQNIKESLFLFLLTKREETALSMAVAGSNARVIDDARAGREPIEPKKYVIYAFGLLLGLGLPITIILIIGMLNDKINSKEEIEQETKTPILGAIGINKNSKTIVVDKGSRSSTAEMFRLLRTNLQFLSPEKANSNRTVLITSSSSGEGKTWITINLGITLALANSKTVLIGLDLRKPKLTKYITGGGEPIGVTNYLVGAADISDIVIQTELNSNLYFVPSGPVPPNPAELLMGERLKSFINELKKDFDYILIDTPPVGLVADALLLNDFIDSSLFVVRANATRRGQLAIVDDIYRNKKLNNINIVLNGINTSRRYGYGYGYGYGYYSDDK
jgi:tyrosine-protein kinase Etk/Wzc